MQCAMLYVHCTLRCTLSLHRLRENQARFSDYLIFLFLVYFTLFELDGKDEDGEEKESLSLQPAEMKVDIYLIGPVSTILSEVYATL